NGKSAGEMHLSRAEICFGVPSPARGEGTLKTTLRARRVTACNRNSIHCFAVLTLQTLARCGTRFGKPSAAKAMPRRTPSLADCRRIGVKVGSSRLVDAGAGRVKLAWLAALAADIAKLHADNRDVLVVSSGAIALGRAVLKLPRGPLELDDSQAAAAVG